MELDNNNFKTTRIAQIFLLAFFIFFMAFPKSVHAEANILERNIRVDLPGKNNFKIVVVNDSHIVEDSDEVKKEYNAYARARKEHFRKVSGAYSTDTWNRMCKKLDEYHADLIVFAGDMVDFYSKKNYL